MTQRLEQTIDDLVAFERTRGLTGGQSIPLTDLIATISERWSKRLAATQPVTTRVDAGGDRLVTRGPVEQVLDTVLADLMARGKGAVDLVAEAELEHVRLTVSGRRVRITPGTPRPERDSGESVTRLLGGRWTGDVHEGGLEILLPRV